MFQKNVMLFFLLVISANKCHPQEIKLKNCSVKYETIEIEKTKDSLVINLYLEDSNNIFFSWDQNMGFSKLKVNRKSILLDCYSRIYISRSDSVYIDTLRIYNLVLKSNCMLKTNKVCYQIDTTNILRSFIQNEKSFIIQKKVPIDSIPEVILNNVYLITSQLFLGSLAGSYNCRRYFNKILIDFPFLNYGAFAEDYMGWKKILILGDLINSSDKK
jgi:hypothetical protein